VLYAALQPGSCAPLAGLPRDVRTTFFRRWLELRRFLRRVFEFWRFPRRLFRWIQFWEFFVERSLDQSRFRRVVFSEFRCGFWRTP
jgi:hypothetical protein